MTEQKPSIGRIVHYVSHGSPVRPDGTQEYASQCRAAIITEVRSDVHVGLCVLNPTGQFFRSLADGGCLFIGSHEAGMKLGTAYPGGTWHWPECRVDGWPA